MAHNRREFLLAGGLGMAGSLLGARAGDAMERQLSASGDGPLHIVPSQSSSAHDFDFLFGQWTVKNRKLKKRLQNCNDWTEFDATLDCRQILNGAGNVDSFHPVQNGASVDGFTLRLFNPETRLWSLYWVGAHHVVLEGDPQVGSFEGGIGRFYARDTWEGKKVIVVYEWEKTNPEHPKWSQAFSTDNGKTWEWNWYATDFRRSQRPTC